MFCLRLRQSFCLKSTNQRQNGSAKSYHDLCYCPVIWCKLNSARNNRFILGNLCFATNKNILFWKGREIQLLLRGSASPASWVSFCMKSCCPLLPFFFLRSCSLCHCKEMTLRFMQLTFLNSLPDWLAKDMLSQSTGCEALLPDSLLKNTSEERGEGEETHLPV